MLAFTELRELSTLDDELESCNELVFITAKLASILEEEFERLKLEALLVAIFALAEFSEASTEEDEFERLFELVLRAPRRASRLDELLERLRLDV